MNKEDYMTGYEEGVAHMEANLERADQLIIDLTRMFVDGRNTEATVDKTLGDLKEYLEEYCTVEHEFDKEYFSDVVSTMPQVDLYDEVGADAYTLIEGELFADWMKRNIINPENEEDYLNYTRIFTRLVNDMKDDSLPEAVPVDEVEPSIIKIFDIEYHEVVEEEEEEKNEWEDIDIPF
tara:strand:+ start:2380 stop:2916 length:537 start_codon:yes stop_codon:yes gene_type:complete